MISSPLFNTIKIGNTELSNRIVMAPLTRRRAGNDAVPTEIMAEYYQQRATAGLLIAEATQISKQATGYLNTPGIYTDEMIQAWKKITSAVHSEGGKVFLQIWHVGRLSHSEFQENKSLAVAPSALVEPAQILTPAGYRQLETPRALLTDEIPVIVSQFAQAAANAIEAGFDGVEIHGANGYLIDQFLRDASNQRSDNYGGSIENRARFLFEVLDEVCRRIGSERTGLRLSPSGIRHGMIDSEPVKLFEYVIKNLNSFNLAYLHLLEPMIAVDAHPQFLKEVTIHFRKFFHNPLITNAGFDFNKADFALKNGIADMVSFGKLFISNPDLPFRFKNELPLNEWDESTFYTGEEKGYIDYPFEKQSR